MNIKHKGFGAKPQASQLISGWLLPELKENYFPEKESINVSSLKTALCFVLGIATLRKNKKKAKSNFLANKDQFVKNQIDYLVVIGSIDSEFVQDFQEKLDLLGKSDNQYIRYIERLYSLSEELVKNGEEIPQIIKLTEDCKIWQKEAGMLLSPEIELKGNWIHPLSDYTEYVEAFDGPGMNNWMAASMLCGIATKRLPMSPDEGDASVSVSKLIQWGIIEIETASTHLEVAGVLDSEYLFLVSKVKEYFDAQVEAGLSR